MSTAPSPAAAYPEWDRIQRGALVAAAAGLVLFVVGAALLFVTSGQTFSPDVVRQFFLSYLVGWTFWLGIGLGCMVILMLQHLTGGQWGLVLRRVLESGSRTLWLLAALFLPLVAGVFLGAFSQYRWADHGWAQEHLKAPKDVYLSPLPFVLRAVVYFAVWLVFSWFLNRWSSEQDQSANPALPRRFRLLSGPGIVLYGATITFASIDWVMSLNPDWYSTIYPVLYAVSQILNAYSFSLIVLMLLASRPPFRDLLPADVMRDLGNLLLAFVMLWAYMSFSQFLLIWVGNLPEEIPYYLQRVRGGWRGLAILLMIFHFGLPFLLLLQRDVKEHPQRLLPVAGLILVMRFLDILWWVEPSYEHEGQYLFWILDVAAVIGVGGLWVWWFLWQLRQRPLLPLHDPRREEAGHHA